MQFRSYTKHIICHPDEGGIASLLCGDFFQIKKFSQILWGFFGRKNFPTGYERYLPRFTDLNCGNYGSNLIDVGVMVFSTFGSGL
jgi:hypothetical protein